MDIVTDGEMRRESYSNRFATALEGIDIDNPGNGSTAPVKPMPVPRVVGKIRPSMPSRSRRKFLRANTDRTIKMTVPGPFTMSQQAQNDFYGDEGAIALDYAAAVNDEIKDLFAAGADIVQIDEPYMQSRPEKARRSVSRCSTRARRRNRHHGGAYLLRLCRLRSRAPVGLFLPAGVRRLDGNQVSIETAQSELDCAVLEKLPHKTIILGTLDLSDLAIETPETIAARIRRALPYMPADRMIVAPDCGLKYLPRTVAFGKMKAMVDGAAIVRREITGA